MKRTDEPLITVLMLKVSYFGEIYQGYLQRFRMSIEALESYVNGTVAMQYLTDDLVFLHNENNEGYLNRLLVGEDGTHLSTINGNILCSKIVDHEFVSVTEEEANLFLYRLRPVKELVSTLQIVVQEDMCEKDKGIYAESE